jgi:hypothetical protein
VPWDQFYGKTASSFYNRAEYQKQQVAVSAGAAAVKQVQSHGADLVPIDRPPQFDFIYKANADQAAHAQEKIGKLLNNQEGLLARRHDLELDENRLWAQLSWEAVGDREIAFRPIYRFALKPADDAHAQLLRPEILFLRTADKAIATALDAVEQNQDATFADLQQRTKDAYAALQQSMADATAAPQLKPEELRDADAVKSICKQAMEECEIIFDNYRQARGSERAKDDPSRLAFRGQLQSAIAHLGTTLLTLDDRITAAADGWHVAANQGAPSPDKLPNWSPTPPAPAAVIPATPKQIQLAGTPTSPTAPPSPAAAPAQSILDDMKVTRGAQVDHVDDGLQLSAANHRSECRIETETSFATPLVITAVAKTNGQNLRLYYGRRGNAMFKGDLHRPELLFEDPKTGRFTNVLDQGSIPKDGWVTIRWCITADTSTIEVDGVKRASFRGDFADVSGTIGIGAHGESPLVIKSVTVSHDVSSAAPSQTPAAATPASATPPSSPQPLH